MVGRFKTMHLKIQKIIICPACGILRFSLMKLRYIAKMHVCGSIYVLENVFVHIFIFKKEYISNW